MNKQRDLKHRPHQSHNRARVSMSAGRHVQVSADVKVTSSGLLAIGGLVSMILLSTAVVVAAARREK